ncbi:MAG: two-component system sensor histidine kinase BarA, partial [Shewanella sp.]
KQFDHWGIQVTNLHSLAQLETHIKQNSTLYDYGVVSCKGLNPNKDFSEQLQAIKVSCHYLIFLSGTNEQNLHIAFGAVDKIFPAPVGTNTLAQTLLDPKPDTDRSYQLEAQYQAEPIAREALSVLAVDDNPANLKLIDTLLKELVTQVTVINNGKGAVNIAEERSFDLIFMDIQMPGTDGISATKQIRQRSLNRNTPIIAVTAHAIAEEKELIQRSGMDGYLPKPIDEAALKSVINRWKTRPKFTHFDPFTLNWELCLTQANQKQDLALEMLKMLVVSIPETAEQIKKSLEKLNQESMLSSIHKLHGACCYCGVPTAQKLCQQIESCLKGGSAVADVEPEILELLDELSKVESAATQVISQLSTDVIDDNETRLL